MAPEQARGQPVDHRTDIYALGCTLFRMLTGRTVFTGATSREVMKKQVSEKAPDIRDLVPEISSKLAAIIAKTLAKDPDQRQQSLNDLVAELEAAMQAGVVRRGSHPKGGTRAVRLVKTGQGETATRRLRATRRSGDSMSYLLVVGVLALVGLGGYFYVKANLQPLPDMEIEEAHQLMDDGDLTGALKLLEGIPLSTDAVAAQINPLIKEVKMRLQEKELEAKWTEVWQHYLKLKQSGAPLEKLQAEIKTLHRQYSSQKPEWRAILEKEIEELGGGVVKKGSKGDD